MSPLYLSLLLFLTCPFLSSSSHFSASSISSSPLFHLSLSLLFICLVLSSPLPEFSSPLFHLSFSLPHLSPPLFAFTWIFISSSSPVTSSLFNPFYLICFILLFPCPFFLFFTYSFLLYFTWTFLLFFICPVIHPSSPSLSCSLLLLTLLLFFLYFICSIFFFFLFLIFNLSIFLFFF